MRLGWVSNFRRAKCCSRDPRLPGGDFFSQDSVLLVESSQCGAS